MITKTTKQITTNSINVIVILNEAVIVVKIVVINGVTITKIVLSIPMIEDKIS